MSNVNIEALIEKVIEHYRVPGNGPLFLSALGTVDRDLRLALINEFGSLLAAIKSAGTSKLVTLNEGRPGSLVVATPEKKDEVAALLDQRSRNSEMLFDALPTALRIAFCLKTEAGQIVGIKLTPPMRYQRFDDVIAMPSGFVAIDGKFRLPGLDLRVASPKEKERLYLQFLSWADKNDIDPDLLRKTSIQSNALERLLAAQPPEILERIVLPADIVALLVRHN